LLTASSESGLTFIITTKIKMRNDLSYTLKGWLGLAFFGAIILLILSALSEAGRTHSYAIDLQRQAAESDNRVSSLEREISVTQAKLDYLTRSLIENPRWKIIPEFAGRTSWERKVRGW